MRSKDLWARQPVSGSKAWSRTLGTTDTTTVELPIPAKHLPLRPPIIPILTLTLLAVSMLNPSPIVTTNNETGYSLYLATVNGRATLASTEGQRRLIRSLVRYPQLDSELIPGDII